MAEFRDKIRELLKKPGKYAAAVLLGVAGIILMTVPLKEKTDGSVKTETVEEHFSVEKEEAKLAKILAMIKGAGRVSVALSVSDSEKTEYAVNSDGERETVLTVKGADGERTVTVRTLYPQYTGAVIVAQGADNAQVRLMITQAVVSLTGLPAGKVSVLTMK